MKKNNFQIVVIGSGPGGALTALNLLESGFDVLLIEKGNYYKTNELKNYSYKEMYEKYNYSGLTLAIGNPNINYVEGSCFGGGSEINSGLYHRLPENILNKWRAKYKLEYSNEKLNKIYTEIEKDLNISYQNKNNIPKASLKLLEGSNKMGLDCIEIPRWIRYEKNKYIKQSMTETYLKKYILLGGKYITGSEVQNFYESNKMFYLNIIKQNKIIKIRTNFLFICSGAIHSPFLLLKSGIKKNIGNTLKMHPSFKFIAKFNEEINFLNMGVPVHQIKSFKKITIGCSISNKAYLGIGLSESGSLEEMRNWKKLASYYVMISPKSYGKIHKIPLINSPIVRYSLNKKDIDRLYFGIRKLGEVLFKAGANTLYPSINSNLKIKSIREIDKITDLSKRKLNLMTIHLFSSIRMGGIKEISATNPFGQLWDHKNIFINDSSILCDSPGVNPQGTIMAFAKYNVDNFIENNKINEI